MSCKECEGDMVQRAAASALIPQQTKKVAKQLDKKTKFILTAVALADIWSKDPSSKVCAIAVGESPNLVAFGYNGFPPNIADTEARLTNRDMKLKLTIHAEDNALRNAWFKVKELYVTHHPCLDCTMGIIAERTVERIYYKYNRDYEERWADSILESRALLMEAGIAITEVRIGE